MHIRVCGFGTNLTKPARVKIIQPEIGVKTIRPHICNAQYITSYVIYTKYIRSNRRKYMRVESNPVQAMLSFHFDANVQCQVLAGTVGPWIFGGNQPKMLLEFNFATNLTASRSVYNKCVNWMLKQSHRVTYFIVNQRSDGKWNKCVKYLSYVDAGVFLCVCVCDCILYFYSESWENDQQIGRIFVCLYFIV